MQTYNTKTSTKTQHSLGGSQCFMSLLRLNCPEEEKPPNSTFMASNINIFSSPPASMIGEYIGIESCIDLIKNNEDVFAASSSETDHDDDHSQGRFCKKDLQWEIKMKKKEFPPPIPLLARTENLHSHMPWVLKRYYTSDGRLILREEKVRHHEYFRAHRCNGRLTLQLVPLDDDVSVPPFAVDEDENEVLECDSDIEADQEEPNEEKNIEENDNDGFESDDDCVNEVVGSNNDDNILEEDVAYEDQRVPSMEIGGNGKCLNYNNVGPISTCIFGVPLPTMRPVQS